MPFPLTGKFSQVKVDNEAIKWKKNTKALSAHRKELDSLKLKQTQYKLYEQNYEQLSVLQTESSKRLSIVTKELLDIPKCNIEEIKERIEFLLINKKLAQTRLSYASEYKNFQAMCAIELSQLQDEYDKLVEHEKIQDNRLQLQSNVKSRDKWVKLNLKISDTEQQLSELDTIENYTNEIERLRDHEKDLIHQQLKIKDRTVVHKCPQCKTFLRIGKKELEIASEQTDERINEQIDSKQLDRELRETRSEKEDYEESLAELKRLQAMSRHHKKELAELDTRLDYSIDYEKLYNEHKTKIQEQEANDKRIRYLKQKIDNKEFSLSIQALNRQIDIKANDIRKMENNLASQSDADKCSLVDKDDFDKLQELLTSSMLIRQRRDILVKQQHQLDSEHKSIIRRLQELSENNPEIVDLSDIITDKEMRLVELEKSESEHKTKSRLIQAYLNYKKEHDNYTHWEDKLSDAKQEELTARTSLTVAEKMLRKIQETESVAVINVIDNINQHLRYYLEKFFLDPITVEIRSFKETSSGDTKSSINLQIGFKGSEGDISTLSGGEIAKVELAICMAINALAGGKLLFLDEILAHVDVESVEEITEILRVDAEEQNKLIVMILHGACEGQFDYIVNID